MSEARSRTRPPGVTQRGHGAKTLFDESQPGLLLEFRSLGESGRRRRFSSPIEVASELGCHPRTVRHWCDAGRIEFVRVGGRLFIDRRSLDRQVAEADDR